MGLDCSKLSDKIEHCREVIYPRVKYKITKFFSKTCYDRKPPTPSPRHISDNNIVIIEIDKTSYPEEKDISIDDIDDITDTKSSNIETSSESNPSKSTQSTSTELTVQVSNKPSDIIEIQPISDSDEDFVKIEYSK